MTLDEYLNTDRGQPYESMRDFAKRSGVSYATIKAVCRGMKLSKYRVALKISTATNAVPPCVCDKSFLAFVGEHEAGCRKPEPLVTIKDLCE